MPRLECGRLPSPDKLKGGSEETDPAKEPAGCGQVAEIGQLAGRLGRWLRGGASRAPVARGASLARTDRSDWCDRCAVWQQPGRSLDAILAHIAAGNESRLDGRAPPPPALAGRHNYLGGGSGSSSSSSATRTLSLR